MPLVSESALASMLAKFGKAWLPKLVVEPMPPLLRRPLVVQQMPPLLRGALVMEYQVGGPRVADEVPLVVVVVVVANCGNGVAPGSWSGVDCCSWSGSGSGSGLGSRSGVVFRAGIGVVFCARRRHSSQEGCGHGLILSPIR